MKTIGREREKPTTRRQASSKKDDSVAMVNKTIKDKRSEAESKARNIIHRKQNCALLLLAEKSHSFVLTTEMALIGLISLKHKRATYK